MKFLVPLVAAVSVLASACGGAANEANLAAAVAKTQDASTSRIEIMTTGREDGELVEFRCEGAADYDRDSLRFDCDYGGGIGDLEMIELAGTTYVRGDLGGFGGSGEKWVKITNEDTGDSLEQLSPQRLLTMLRSASRETERVGEEEVRGASTVRYRLEIECERAEIDCEGPTTPVEVWIGDNGLVRRISLEEGPAEATMEFYDFGVDVAIAAPPADQVQKAEDMLAPRACEPGEAEPISVSEAIGALRAHGFRVTGNDECFAGVAGSISNVASDPDDEWLSCYLIASQTSGAVVVDGGTSLGGAHRPVDRELENLRCTLFARAGPSDEAVARLDAAFADLKRAIRP